MLPCCRSWRRFAISVQIVVFVRPLIVWLSFISTFANLHWKLKMRHIIDGSVFDNAVVYVAFRGLTNENWTPSENGESRFHFAFGQRWRSESFMVSSDATVCTGTEVCSGASMPSLYSCCCLTRVLRVLKTSLQMLCGKTSSTLLCSRHVQILIGIGFMLPWEISPVYS